MRPELMKTRMERMARLGIGFRKNLMNEPETQSAVSSTQLVMPHDLMTKGGKWLGAAREWLQWNRLNGDSVIWGSHDILRPAFNVRDVELFAAHVAAAAINEERERVQKTL